MAWDNNAEKILGEKLTDALEECDISISNISKNNEEDKQFIVEMEWDSPAGEDFVIDVWVKEADTLSGVQENFVSAFREYADNFDADEHAELFIDSRGKGGCPATISELVHDAEEIQDFLNETADKLESIDIEVTFEQVIDDEKVINTLQKNSIDVSDFEETADGYEAEVSYRSPMGEDVSYLVSFNDKDDFISQMETIADEYDPQMNADEWSQRRGISISEDISYSELFADATAIKERFEKVVDELHGKEPEKLEEIEPITVQEASFTAKNVANDVDTINAFFEQSSKGGKSAPTLSDGDNKSRILANIDCAIEDLQKLKSAIENDKVIDKEKPKTKTNVERD